MSYFRCCPFMSMKAKVCLYLGDGTSENHNLVHYTCQVEAIKLVFKG